ncbi:Hypp3967 [Branchiostoma lanceolatum]|uniref:Hypp3967 protein n=1 Tax=Branchiostoma lanceolatum TaxID=7740 RepID=A0A8K0A518_BRALA|nr:Hypp3967 [Branchiostoma lanceolatum]
MVSMTTNPVSMVTPGPQVELRVEEMSILTLTRMRTYGDYHITVRAINNVGFGGAMATTVCHTTPYIIDNTPPFVHHVHSVQYDETDFTISAEYNVSDPLSDIREIDFGLGRSKRDVHMMDWYRHGNTTHTSVNFHIPDGVPAWVKVRAINNVDLREVGHADQPVLVDTSPPIAGILYDGSLYGHDLNFTSDPNTICANWKDFHDEESGLSHYEWGVGSEPGTDDVVSLTEYSHTASQTCADVQLIHNTTYYSILVAFNNGHDNLNVSKSSDGVLFDATPPVEGTLRDGLDPDSDLQFSFEPSTVSANWDGYSDPESGIGDYAVTVQRTSFSEEATNQAMDSTVTSSDGFIMDLTKPVMVHLGDGAEPGEDRAFSADASRISANWIFEDAESGIEKYMITVFKKAAGTKRQIYPEREESVEIDGKQKTWTSPAHLNLINGALYFVRVAAVNGAGATTVHETNGLIVDTSPPGMVNVRVGVTSGEPEELEDGYVLHTDLQGIQASWMATDFESGVVSYWVAVGTTPGGNDVIDYQSLGPGTDSYVGNLDLQLTNKTTNSPIYYLIVKAENAAGSFSRNITSSPIKVVRADQAGTVTDGWETWTTVEQAMTVDVDYQRDVSTVTVQFGGFESEQHGISHYEWSVGTEPRLDDVQPYTAAGIVLSNHTENPGGAEMYSKKQNLLFWGIQHDASEDVEKKVREFMSAKLQVSNADSIPFVNVHRLPRMKGNPIIVKFVSQLHRDTVLRHAFNLPPNSGSGVSQHLPVALQKKKQELRLAFDDARKKNRKPKYRVDGAQVTGGGWKNLQDCSELF